MDSRPGPVVEATRTNADGTGLRWTVVAADERWLIAQAVSSDGHTWTTTSAAVVDTLDEAIGHHPALTEVATDSRLQVQVDESELLPEEFAAWLRCERVPGHDLPSWCDPEALARVNENSVHFLSLGLDLIAVLRDGGGDVVGRRRAVHRWTDSELTSVTGQDELVEIGPGIAVSVAQGGEPELVAIGTRPTDRADCTVQWLEHVVQPGILLFEPVVGDATRRDWMVAREDRGHRFEFSFGDDTDHLLGVRRMAVLHPEVDVERVWAEMRTAATEVENVPGQRSGSDAVRTR